MTEAFRQSHAPQEDPIAPLDRRLGPVMFLTTTLFLAVVGLAVQLVSEESERHGDLIRHCGWGLAILWGLFPAEVLLHRGLGHRVSALHVWACLFPPLRLAARDHSTLRNVWLPGLGWQVADDDLAERIELNLGYPMIGVALLILPLLAIELFATAAIQGNDRLALAIQIAGALIWVAFAMEFLVMVSLVSRKFRFIKSHWLDLAIICLPLIAFLRTARLGRLLRLNQLGKLTKTTKMFRLRGLAMRAWRAVLILEIVDRILHRDPQKRLRLLEGELVAREAELADLRAEIESIRKAIPNADETAACFDGPIADVRPAE